MALPRVMHSTAVQHRIGELLAQNLAASNILGRAQILRHAKRKTGKVLPFSTMSRKRQFDEGDDAAVGDDLSLGFDLNLPAEDASQFIRDLTPVTRQIFDGLTTQYRKDAFTLAGAADVRLIEKVRDELAEIAEKGGTAGEFEAAVNHITDEAGVQRISAFSLDTAFNTAMLKAYSLGRLEQMSDPAVVDVLPYWQYLTVGDDRVRPEHAVLDYFTARAEDPVWRKIWPPSGFNCRCITISLLASEAGKDADDPGMERLPVLALLKVPQAGFHSLAA